MQTFSEAETKESVAKAQSQQAERDRAAAEAFMKSLREAAK